MSASPAPIRGRWTIWACPLCGFMDPDQYDRSPSGPRYCVFAARGLSRDGIVLHPYGNSPDWNPNVEFQPVEVVPVPDEAAIERGARVITDERGEDMDSARWLVEEILRAALEPTDP